MLRQLCKLYLSLCKVRLSFHARDAQRDKLSWEETYRAMRAANEDWSDLEIAVADGLE